MKARIPRYLMPALLAATIPATAVLAQAPPPQQPEPQQKRERPDRPRLSPDARKRLQEGRQEGRIAEIKQALKLNDAQLKLWAPVEQQLRARFAARRAGPAGLRAAHGAAAAGCNGPAAARHARSREQADDRARPAHAGVRRGLQALLRRAERGAEGGRWHRAERHARRHARTRSPLGDGAPHAPRARWSGCTRRRAAGALVVTATERGGLARYPIDPRGRRATCGLPDRSGRLDKLLPRPGARSIARGAADRSGRSRQNVSLNGRRSTSWVQAERGWRWICQ